MASSSEPASGRKPGPVREALELAALVAIAVALGLGVRTLVAEQFVIPSGSMESTLNVGDHLIGEKLTYRGSSPAAGDIVTFTDPEDAGTTLIKRVIATEGQVVDLVDGVVYVDGEALDEPYTHGKPSYELGRHSSTLTAGVSFPYTVPSGCVWVMGDNRTNSLDSRYFGAIPVSSVTSRACFVFWPPEDFGSL